MEKNKTESNDTTPAKKQLSDYILGSKIGEGAYSKVVVCKERSSKKIFAIKIIKKALIIKLNKRNTVFRERNIMDKLRNHPFFVNIHCSFQDSDYLYFVLSYARRGELLRYINELQGLDQEATQFYSSEIVSALEYLHSKDIIHRYRLNLIHFKRDLKPENILINQNYHILITDFGTSKFLEEDDKDRPDKIDKEAKRPSSFVGTAQYVSPELLNEKQICKSSDLWSLGVTIYQMVTSQWPFYSVTEYLIFEKIRKIEYKIPESFPDICKDLVQKLLKANPYERLGDSRNGGYPALKSHSFFKGVDWDNLLERPPPKQLTLCSLELLPTIPD